MKRILTIQDISCVGKCSLTVALPIISAFGVETAVLPTAILSTHTAFNNFSFNDLTNDIANITKVWKKENISFDGIYTGYLGSFEQLEIVSEIFDEFKKENNFIIVDPVMADNGVLYKGFDQNFANSMANLCKKAEIIVPNLTEASYLLKKPCIINDYSEEYIKETLRQLTDLGCKKAVLTGVTFDKENLGVYGYDAEKNEYFSYYKNYLPQSFHGTGDVFASTLCGSLASGLDFNNAIKLATDYTVECINLTIKSPNHRWYGVEFEKALPYLIKRISK